MPYRSIRGKNYTGEAIWRKCAWDENLSEDGAKLNMRWMRGVFVGKLDRTDEFLLSTPTGAMKTRCVRRLEGDNAWDLQFLNLCDGSPWNATGRSTQQKPTIQQKDNFGWHVELDQRYVKFAGCHGDESLQFDGHSWIERTREQSKVADLTEKLDPQEHREFRSGAGICQCMTEQRFQIAFSTKEIMKEAAGPTTASKTKLKRIARYLK